MPRETFSRRFISPVVRLAALTTASYVVYLHPWGRRNPIWDEGVTFFSGALFFLCVGLGVLYVYPKARLGGAGAFERVIAGLVTPVLWSTKDVIAVWGVYPWAQAVYYYLNPVNMLLYAAVLAEIGLSELACRRKMRLLGRPASGSSFTAWAALVIGLGLVVFQFAWDLGVHHFYIFQEGYKALFGYGL